MNKIIPTLFAFAVLFAVLISCGSETKKSMFTDNFNRETTLAFWADEIIIPAFESYQEKLTNLSFEMDAFYANPTVEQLDIFRSSWLDAYKSWQHVSIFDIGKAETINLRLYSNIFPTNTELIDTHISAGTYNLELPSNFAAQGFPALDYLLYGKADTDESTVNVLIESNHKLYIIDLVDRLNALTNTVLADWNGDYRDAFVANSGSSATSSFDKLVNDYLFYYEKYFRAGKVGIPAGVFSGNHISTAVEAPHSGIYSKVLFEEAFIAIRDFFNGVSFDKSREGQSLSAYLDYIQSLTETNNLNQTINNQWELALSKSSNLSDNFKEAIEENHIDMLEVYDELQKVVILLKVDMLQYFCVKIDYIDADGD